MKEAPPKKGAPAWMATFADMATLLMTFFVLLLSFSSMDVAKFQEMLGSVAQAYGVSTKLKGEYQAVLEDNQLDKVAKKEQKKWDEELEKELEEDVDKEIEEEVDKEIEEEEGKEQKKKETLKKLSKKIENSIKKQKMEESAEVITGNAGIRIRIKGYQMFNAGSADIKKQNLPFLETIYQGMKLFDYNLLVEGHTDNRPVYSEKFPSNWELSSARASSVIRYLQDKKIDPQRLSAVGYADQYPIADNSDKTERAKNRRVEFIFTQKELRMAIEDSSTEEENVAGEQ